MKYSFILSGQSSNIVRHKSEIYLGKHHFFNKDKKMYHSFKITNKVKVISLKNKFVE